MITRIDIDNIIERTECPNLASAIYDWFMVAVVLVSLIPLMLMEEHDFCFPLELVCTAFFVIDYLLRWITADIRLKKGRMSFLIYPITPMAIIDLLSILPILTVFNQTLRLLRFVRLLRILRVIKLAWYLEPIAMFCSILYKERIILFSVLIIAQAYIFVTALILFNIEPHVNPYTGTQTFRSFFDALYWATVTLTTVGYGDLCPVTDIGRAVGMLSSIFGVAIIALPSGVITASYMDALRQKRAEAIKNKHKAEKKN